jgi:exopolysaccharide biosynthesis polyprenyl glycosylphosphotransferase
MALGDLAAVNLAVLVALRVWAAVGELSFSSAFILGQFHWFVILSLLWLLLAAANDFYNLRISARWLQSQARLITIQLQLLLIYLLIFFLSPRDALPRLFIVYYAVVSYILIALWRLGRPFLARWEALRQRVLVIGTGWAAQTIIEAIQTHAPDDYEVIGVIDEAGSAEPGGTVIDAPVIGHRADLVRIARELHASEIVLATSGEVDGVLFQGIMDCYEAGIPIIPMPILYEQFTRMVPVEYVRGHWSVILPLEGHHHFDPYPLLKRLVDIGISLVGLILFSVLLPLIALAMVIDSSGPVFYRQERVGRAGRPFNLFKLRTMIPDAEKLSGPIWAVQDDPRMTVVGKWLRRTRLDEAPQLFNVLRGDMSIIGPRPERPHFVAYLQQQIPFYRTRLAVRPGVTGWAQVNFGYGSTDTDQLIKLKYDLYYIRHRSVLLDLLILLRTVGRVIRLEGR